jgi:hypothetical protein
MEISLSDLPLEHKVETHLQSFIHVVGKKVVVGYLTYDTDCENPFDNDDYMGNMYKRSDDSSNMQKALALDADWNPQLDIIASSIVAMLSHQEIILWSDAYGVDSNQKALLDELNSRDSSSLDDDHFKFAESIWQEEFSAGRIGNPYAVALSLYSHSGESWSMTNDLVNIDGVWTPSDYLEVERRVAALSFGDIVEVRDLSKFQVKFDDGVVSECFDEWGEALNHLIIETSNKKPTSAQFRQGQVRAAESLASGSLESYNDWLNGACYGVVTAIFENDGDEDEPEWVLVESDCGWGYIGSDYAEVEAESIAKVWADRLQAEISSKLPETTIQSSEQLRFAA